MASIPLRTRTGLLAVHLAALFGSALALETRAPKSLGTPAPAIALKPPALADYASDACVACHADVAREWATTAHAIAWVDTEYQEQLADKKKPETCWGCHVPKPLLQGDLAQKPAARAEGRELGITCASCHAGAGGKVLGPRGTPTSAHVSEKADVFVKDRSNALCISCHRFNVGPVIGIAKDFVDAGLGEKGFACLDCHAADVEMRFASKNGDEDPPSRKGKSHAIQTPRDPAFLAQAFELVLDQAGGKAVVRVRNQAGHRVPGLVGRSIEIEAQALDAGGSVVATKKLVIDATSYLPLAGELALDLGVAAARARVTGRHLDPRADLAVVFLERELEPAR